MKLINSKGQSLIELLVAMGLLTIFIPALVSGISAARNGKAQQAQRLGAIGLLKESEEAVRATRNNDWINIKTSGTYHPDISGNTWVLNSGSESIDGYTRSIAISDVYRDDTGDISTTGTILDPSTKKVDLTVSWDTPQSSQVSSSLYLTRFVSNTALPGSGTILPLSGHGDWCNPVTDNYNRINLYHSSQPSSVIAGINKAYVGTTKDSSGYAFDNVSIDHTATPFTLIGETNYQSSGLRANDVYAESSYAYIAPDSNTKEEVLILDVSGTDPILISSVNISGNNKGAKTVFVAHNSTIDKDILYFVASDNNLYSYDVTTRSAPVSKGMISVGDTSRMFVVDNYVYLAQTSTSNQFQIIDASDPANLKKPGSKGFLKVNDQPGQDVFVNTAGTRAYFITVKSNSNPEFFIINISDKTNPSIIGTGYDTFITINPAKQTDPKGITVINSRAIVVGFGSPPYQVFRIDGDNYDLCKSVTTLGSFTMDSIYDVSSILNNGHAYSYLIADNSSAELQIIEGGSGGAGGSGMFESTTFDAGHDVAWNSFTATVDPNLSYKFSIKHGSGGNCAGVTFSATDYIPLSPGPLPLSSIGSGYVNPGQCMRYQVINLGTAAVNYSITINYSP